MLTFVAAVSGANKGIGLEIVRLLAGSKPVDSSVVLLGSRDAQRGRDALDKIRCPNARLLPLDIDSPASIQSAVKQIKDEYGRLDVLVCNAGIASKGSVFNEAVARKTLETNFTGTWNLVEAALPLLRESAPGARIVFVSSKAGNLARVTDPALRVRILNAASPNDLADLGDDFIASVADNTYAKKGWPQNTYGVSKILVTGLARVLAKDPRNKGIASYACCPGWVRTDMGGQNAGLSPAEGADTPVWLATSDDPLLQNSSGAFFSKRQLLKFEDGFPTFS